MNLKNPEVFAIKGDTAFVGGKLDNGNFHFIQIPFTDPNFKKQQMTYQLLTQMAVDFFIKSSEVETPFYAGSNEQAARALVNKLNTTPHLAIYQNNEGLWVKWADFNGNIPPRCVIKYTEDSPNILELFRHFYTSEPMYLERKPDNELRQAVWSETYLASLQDGGSIIVASCDADAMLQKFDNLFTQKTPL